MTDWTTFLAGAGAVVIFNTGVGFYQHWRFHRKFKVSDIVSKALNAVGHDGRYCDACKNWAQHTNETVVHD